MSNPLDVLFFGAPVDANYARPYPGGIDYYKRENSLWLYYANGKWERAYCTSENDCVARLQPKPWSGPEDGLPPVGMVCEFAGGTECPEDPFDKDLKEGMKATIIAHFKCGDFTLAAFTFDPENPDRGMVQVEQATFGCFRPIRTPEQLAAEERERTRKIGVAQMMEHIHFSLPKELWGECEPACYALYDAGFKREVV